MGKIIFTDCFNTIILRKASCKEVLFNWCERLGVKYDIEPVVIYNLFDKLKRKKRITSFFRTGEAEIKFNDVAEIGQVLKKSIHDLNLDSFKKDFLDTYIEAEQESHYLNEEFVKKLKQEKADGAKIYVLSDFYCGKEVLKQWLNNLGIADLFEDIFVSSDYMVSKRSSKLYKKVIRELGISKKDITMFGDNLYSDIIGARRAGVKSVRIHTKIKKTPKEFKKIKQLGRHYKELDEIFNRYGDNYNYSNHAFPLFLFIRRLCLQLEKREVKNVFFLSREGKFLKKLFDNYCTITGRCANIKSHYLQVSRNALYRVNLKPLEEQDWSYLLNKLYKFNVYQFLNSLSFSEQEIADVQREIGENIKKKKKNFDKTETFKKLINSEAFKNVYEAKRLEQEGVFDKYLQSFGVDFLKEGINVVDVGWRGSMQDMLSIHLGNNINIYGWYIGYLTGAFCRNYPETNPKAKNGLLHHMGKKKQFGNKCFKPIFCDYEQICRANHGSVYGYKVIGNEVEVIYEDKIDEEKLHQKYILPLQTQIENKFNDLCKIDFKNLSIIEPLAVIRHMDIYKKLSRQDVDFYINALDSHFDNFGAVGLPKVNSDIRRAGFKASAILLRLRFARFSNRRVFNSFYNQIDKGILNNISK